MNRQAVARELVAVAKELLAVRPGSPVDIGNRREELIIDGLRKLAKKFGFKLKHIPNQSHRIDSRGNISFYIDQPKPYSDDPDDVMRFPPALVRLMKSTGEPGLKYVHEMSNGVEANHFSWEKLLIKAGINKRQLLDIQDEIAGARGASVARELAAQHTPFERELEKAIKKAIRDAKRDGLVSMGLDNLMQVVRPPSSSLDGAPKGTNARYFYKQMFEDMVKGNRFVKAAERLADDDPMAGERIGKLFMALHTWTTKQLERLPPTAPVAAQLLEHLNEVEKRLRGKGSLRGKEAVESMIKAMSRLYTIDAAPLKRLWRKYGDPVEELLYQYRILP